MKRISAVLLMIALILFGNVLAQADNRAGFKGYDWGTSLKTIKSSKTISEVPSDSKWLKYIRRTPRDAMSLQEFLGIEKMLFEDDLILTNYIYDITHRCVAVYGFLDDKLVVGAYIRLTANDEEERPAIPCQNFYGLMSKTLQILYGEEAKYFGDGGKIWYTKRSMILLYHYSNTFLSVFPGYRKSDLFSDGNYPICWALVYRDRSQLKAIRAIRKKPTKRVESIRAQRAKEAEEARRRALDKL